VLEVFVDSPTPGTVTPIAVLAQPAQVGDTQFVITAALPTVLQGTGQFHAIIDTEIVVIPCQTGTTLTGVTRGTSPSAHAAGAAVSGGLTAEALNNALANAQAAAEAASDPSGTAAVAIAALNLGTASTHAATDFAAASALTTEATTRATADTTNATAITAETTRATTAEALKVASANNGSDFADAGSTRANLHVPDLTPAACVVTSNVTTLSGLNIYDDYQTVAGDLILLTAQSTASQNGLWTAASGAWTRPTEMGTGVVLKARTVAVINGTTNGGSTWLLKTNTAIVVDTGSQTWVTQLPSSVASVSAAYAAGQLVEGPNIDGGSL
jgi:hypothetical protein